MISAHPSSFQPESSVSGAAAERLVARAVFVLVIVGLLDLGLGAYAEMEGAPFLLERGIGWVTAAGGVAYAGLAWAGFRFRMILALVLSFALFAMEAARNVLTDIGSDPGAALAFAAVYALISWPIVRAAPALTAFARG